LFEAIICGFTLFLISDLKQHRFSHLIATVLTDSADFQVSTFVM